MISLANGGFDSLSMILLFIGILLLVYLAARFFVNDSYTVPAFFEKIPGIETLYEIVRSVPSYLTDVIQLAFGKKDSVSLAIHRKNTQERDKKIQTSLQEYFIEETLPFRPFWIFVPFFNLVFLPKLLTSRTTKYVLAIGQGLVITLLAILIGFSWEFTSPLELFLLFPVFYGIASIESDVFIRIPILYEVYAMLNTLTFGLLKNTKRVHSAQSQDTTVSFKMD